MLPGEMPLYGKAHADSLLITAQGGVGLAEKAFRMRDILLTHALTLLSDCPCPQGCPSCVGPVGEIGPRGKQMAKALLEDLLK